MLTHFKRLKFKSVYVSTSFISGCGKWPQDRCQSKKRCREPSTEDAGTRNGDTGDMISVPFSTVKIYEASPLPRSMDPLSIIVRIWICFLNKGVLKDRFLCSRKSRSIRRMEHFFRFVAFLGLYTFLRSNYLLFRRVISQKLHRWIPPLFFPVRSNIESSGRPCWLDLDRKKWYIRL